MSDKPVHQEYISELSNLAEYRSAGESAFRKKYPDLSMSDRDTPESNLLPEAAEQLFRVQWESFSVLVL